MVCKVIAIVVCVLMTLKLVYLFLVVWSNGCESKHRVFSILFRDTKVYRKPYLVQWRFLWFPFKVWHNYITDAHYMDYAEFATEKEARDYIDTLYYQEKKAYTLEIENNEI